MSSQTIHKDTQQTPAAPPAIGTDPGRMGGTPCFYGTRVPVATLWDYLEGGENLDEFLEDFPAVKAEQCVQVLRLAFAQVLVDRRPG